VKNRPLRIVNRKKRCSLFNRIKKTKAGGGGGCGCGCGGIFT